jgi:hypothetical protein
LISKSARIVVELMNQLGPSAVYLEFGGASNAAGKEFTFQN